MITQIVTAFMTSEDLFEMARKAREIEQNGLAGDSTEIRAWMLGDGNTLRILLDQERAGKKGLMK